MREGDHVILATAEPDWLYRDIHDPVAESNLGYLEEKVINPTGARVHLWLSGDLHHYRRHEHATDPTKQRIVSGGGGAYLAATHKPFFGPEATSMRHSVTVGEQRFEQRRAFPTPATALRLSLLNWLVLFNCIFTSCDSLGASVTLRGKKRRNGLANFCPESGFVSVSKLPSA